MSSIDNKNVLYFDTAGGAAGDMLLASLANMNEEYKNKLEDVFKVLLENLDGVKTSVTEIEVQGIRSHYVDIRMEGEHNHEHHNYEHHNHEHHNHEHHNHEHHNHEHHNHEHHNHEHHNHEHHNHEHHNHEHHNHEHHNHEHHNHEHHNHEHHNHEHHNHEHHNHEHHNHEHHNHEHHNHEHHNHEHHNHEHHNHEHHNHEHHNHEHHNHEHHNHEHHNHEHRNLASITKLINDSPIPENAKNNAIEVFKIIAEAEAYVHRKSLDEVHFHEVGAYDSILDIVSFCVLVDYIAPEKIISTPLPMGVGMIKCAHGTMPNPAPATVEILKGIPVYQTSIKGEMVTPTAAALLKHFVTEYTHSFDGIIKSVGNGAGGRRYEGSSCLCRALLLEMSNQNSTKSDEEKHYILEANIDDMTGEALSYVQTLLMNNGASDCWFTPIIMKKSRPAHKINVLATKGRKDSLIKMMLRQTTTLGVRIIEVEKAVVFREIVKLETEHGVVNYKVKRIDDKVHVKPEYEDVKNIAMKKGLSVAILTQELTTFYYSNCRKQ